MPTAPYTTPFQVDLLSKSEYFPYGMKIEELGWNAEGVEPRYGYNGKEKDNEVKGESNSLDFGARIYDPRGARFLSQDPLKSQFAFQSPFIFASDKPINSIDKDGEKEHIMIFHQVNKQGNTFVTKPDDKMTYSNNGKARTWSDNKMGSAVNENHYIYENKMYNKKTDLPGKAGEFFKREKENTDNLVNSAILGVPLAAVTAPVMSGAVATWSVLSAGYEMYASIKNNNDNSTQKQDYLSPSLLGQIGKNDVKAINKQYGTNIDPKDGEKIGFVLDLFSSGSALYKNIKNINKVNKAFQIPYDINSTINSTSSISNSFGKTNKPNKEKED
jgi:RHS repeat-associated protein